MNKMIKSVLLLSTLTLCMQSASAQVCNANMIKNAPDSRYTNNIDGTIYDTKTKLTWMRCSIGQTWKSADDSCSGAISKMTWEGALQTANPQNSRALLGKSDWRLPNIKELKSLVEFSCYASAINETLFPSIMVSDYWSSSVAIDDRNEAWRVGFYKGDGASRDRNSNYSVRLVRGGQ